MELAKYLDYTNLSNKATRQEINQMIENCIKYGFYGLCISPCWTLYAKNRLKRLNATTKLISVPNWVAGGGLEQCEGILDIVCDVCDEVDFIWNIYNYSDLKAWDRVEKELKEIRELTKGKVLKVIIEAYYLRKMDENVYKLGLNNVFKEACRLVRESGADYIKCLEGSTSMLVKIDNKILYTTIKDLYDHHKKDVVYLPSVNKKGQFKWVKVLNTIKQVNKKECLQLRLSNGLFVTCTQEHKLPYFGRTIRYERPFNYTLKQTSEFKKGDYIGFINNLQYNSYYNNEIYDYNLGFFVGAFLAEGTYSKTNRVRFHLGPRDKKSIIPILLKVINKYGYKYNISKDKGSKGFTFFVNSPMLRALLQDLIIGKISKTKHLSNMIYNLPLDFRTGLLDGYLEGNASTKDSKIYHIGMTNNRTLLADFIALCKTVGYAISIGQKDYYLIKYRNKTYKKLNFQIYKNKRRPIGLRQIVDIKRMKKRWVYDIQTEKDNIFFTGYGILVHNSDSGLFKRPEFETLAEDIKIIKKYSKGLQIKASGGVSTKTQVEQLIKAGADRIGTSKALEIIKGT
jgi:deoxyribose-phosphate aldolase